MAARREAAAAPFPWRPALPPLSPPGRRRGRRAGRRPPRGPLATKTSEIIKYRFIRRVSSELPLPLQAAGPSSSPPSPSAPRHEATGRIWGFLYIFHREHPPKRIPMPRSCCEEKGLTVIIFGFVKIHRGLREQEPGAWGLEAAHIIQILIFGENPVKTQQQVEPVPHSPIPPSSKSVLVQGWGTFRAKKPK